MPENSNYLLAHLNNIIKLTVFVGTIKFLNIFMGIIQPLSIKTTLISFIVFIGIIILRSIGFIFGLKLIKNHGKSAY